MATAACRAEQQGDSSDDSDAEPFSNTNVTVGNMHIVENILNGIAKHSTEEGEKGMGRHGSTIRLGRSLWQTPALASHEASRIRECLFAENAFPERQKCRKALESLRKQDDERPMPFAGATEAYARHSTVDYGARLSKWFQVLTQEAERPNDKELKVLRGVSDRILVECRVIKSTGSICYRMHPQDRKDRIPLHGCTHGEPGTGKSKVINWITRMFTEAMGWTHGVEFLNVAFQNRVAHAMGGTTLHSGGDLSVGGEYKSLSHTDIDLSVVRGCRGRCV